MRLRLRAKDSKKSEAKAMDSPSKDRTSRGQEQQCSRPRTKDTSASVLQKKKNCSQNFQEISRKNVSKNFFHALHKTLPIQKIVLSSSRGQANFRGLEASRPRPRTSKGVLEDSTSAKYKRKIISEQVNKM